jgi:hypothetical protein
MYKALTLVTLIAGLVAVPVLRGGSVDLGSDREQTRAPEVANQLTEQATLGLHEPGPVELTSCEWACQACEAGQGCTQTCTEIGDCGSVCGVIARCEVGHRWDDSACACVGS